MGKLVAVFLVSLAVGALIIVGPSLAVAVQAIEVTIHAIGG